MNSILNWGRSRKRDKAGFVNQLKPTQQQLLDLLGEKIRQRDLLNQEISSIYQDLSTAIPVTIESAQQQPPLINSDPMMMTQSAPFIDLIPATTVPMFNPDPITSVNGSFVGNGLTNIDSSILNDPELVSSLLQDDFTPVPDFNDDENEENEDCMEQDTLSPLFMQTDTTNTSSGSIDGSDMTSAQPHSHLKAKKKRGPYKKRQNENRQCVRCGTRESPAWRCKRTGFLMCNACGIWMKKHGGGCKAWLIDGANNNNNNNIR